MIDSSDIAPKIARLEKLMARKFGASSGPFEARVRKVGRRVPSKVRSDLKALSELWRLAQNPKLGRQLDPARFDALYQRVKLHLDAVDAADRRKGAILGALGGLAFNLIALFVVVLAVLLWRGFV